MMFQHLDTAFAIGVNKMMFQHLDTAFAIGVNEMTNELVIKIGGICFIIYLISLIAMDVYNIIRYWRNKK